MIAAFLLFGIVFLSLLQRQQAPSLTLSESESSTLTLRERYLRACIDGVNSAQEHIFLDVPVGQSQGQTDQNETVGASTLLEGGGP